MTRSLRFRLLAGASISAAVVLSLLGFSIYGAMKHALFHDFDSTLTTQSVLLAQMAEQSNGKVTFDFDSSKMPEFLSPEAGRYFEIWLDDGTVLARSASLGTHDLSVGPRQKVEHARVGPEARYARSYTYEFSPNPEEIDGDKPSTRPVTRTAKITVAAEPRDLFHTLNLLGWMLTLLCAGAVVLMGLVHSHLVSRGLRPLKAIAREIESLKETDLNHRLHLAGAPDELLPVVDKLNELLGRLARAFAREKSFTADVAHELRTPLTGLATTLEVCRTRPRDTQAYETAIDECRAITDRMAGMVESLLLLARSDAGQLTVQHRKTDLSGLVAEAWKNNATAAEHRHLRSELNLNDSCPIETDPDKLHIIVRNLIDNAVSHADDGGLLKISVTPNGKSVYAEFTNSGSQISSEEVPRLFERFWRGDAARAGAGMHCGLGLSICQRLTTLLGGEISVDTAKGKNFTIRLKLPIAKQEKTN
jgi:two-component system sensor histidine kinase QseC